MLRALNNRVLIRPDAQPDKTKGGIVIPDTAKDEITTICGTVLSVGPKVVQVKAGEQVVWNKHHGLDIAYRGEVLLSIFEEELLAADDPDTPEEVVAGMKAAAQRTAMLGMTG